MIFILVKYIQPTNPQKPMRLKISLLTIFLYLLAVGITEVHAQTNLTVKFKDGTQKISSINSVGKLTVSDQNLVIKLTDGTASTYLLTAIQKIIFDNSTEVNNIANQKELLLYPNPATDFILLKNAVEGQSNITIYSMDGALLASTNIYDPNQQIDISSLPKGLYILKVNNQVLKFSKL